MKQRKNNKGFRRPVIIKNKGKQPGPQPSVVPITGKKIPKSFGFCRGKLPVPLKQLQMDLRKLPLTAKSCSVRVRSSSRFSFRVLFSRLDEEGVVASLLTVVVAVASLILLRW